MEETEHGRNLLNFATQFATQISETATLFCYLKQTRFRKIMLLDRKKEMFYLTTHSTHLICGYMSDIW